MSAKPEVLRRHGSILRLLDIHELGTLDTPFNDSDLFDVHVLALS